MNVFPPDTAGVFPAVDEVRVINQSLDISDSTEVEEFSVLRVIASVSDDILVRQVQFVASGPDGEILRTLDSSFPYSTTFAVPGLEPGGNSTLTLQVIAWDIAGNVAPSVTKSYEIVPDTTPPVVNIASPEDNSTVLLRSTSNGDQVAEDLPVQFYFSEPVVLASSPSVFFLLETELGPVNITTIDLSFSSTLNRLEFTIPKEVLSFQTIYNISIEDELAADGRGNPSGSASWSFQVASNEIFPDTPFACTVTPVDSCLLRFRRPANTVDRSSIALSIFLPELPAFLSGSFFFNVFKGPDNLYPQIDTGYTYCSISSGLRVRSLPKAFVLDPFV